MTHSRFAVRGSASRMATGWPTLDDSTAGGECAARSGPDRVPYGTTSVPPPVAGMFSSPYAGNKTLSSGHVRRVLVTKLLKHHALLGM